VRLSGSYAKGKVISGLDAANALPNTKVFHAGTAKSGNPIVTNGGRVLGVTALARIEERANHRLRRREKIHFDGAQFRHDIAPKLVGLSDETQISLTANHTKYAKGFSFSQRLLTSSPTGEKRRRLPQSKTLARIPTAHEQREASWSAPVPGALGTDGAHFRCDIAAKAHGAKQFGNTIYV